MKLLTSDTHRFDIKYVRARLDDIEDVLHAMQEAGLATVIRDSTHEYESLDELVEKRGTRIWWLRMEGRLDAADSAIVVTFGRADSEVVSDLPTQHDALAFRISAMLDQRRSKAVEFLDGPGFFLLVPVVGLVLGLTISDLGLATVPIAAGILLPTFFISLTPTIQLRRRHVGGFFSRNLDAILIGLISAAAGSLITLAIQWLTGIKSP